MSDELPDGVARVERAKDKRQVIELWAESVMRDPNLRSVSIRVAWGLSFRLDEELRTWETRSNLAARIKLGVDHTKAGVRDLCNRGHILTRRERVFQPSGARPLLMVTRPCFSVHSGGLFIPASPRKRIAKGGDSAHPLGGDNAHWGGGDSAHPCNRKGNLKEKPKAVAGPDYWAELDEGF